MVSKTIAVIPARGGSKRIPQKNIIEFHGKPLIAWTIEEAIRSGSFSAVYVDTDDVEISEVARRNGALVPFLRSTITDEFAPVASSTIEFLTRLGESSSTFVVQLMANCPLRTSDDIKRFHEFMVNNNCDFLLSCFELSWMNPWWSFKMNEKGHSFLFPDALKSRSQDLEPLFCPSGAIWGARIEKLLAEGTFYGSNHQFFKMPWSHAIDIDTHDDLEMAIVLKDMVLKKS